MVPVGLASEHLGRATFQQVDGRVFTVDVVAHLSSSHGRTHFARWPSYGVGAEIDGC